MSSLYNLRKYAVFAMADNNLAEAVRQYQEGLSSLTGDRRALRFPVHITLRGPFWTYPASIGRLTEIMDDIVHGGQSPFGPIPVDLSGPVFVKPDLGWLEVVRKTTGFSQLLALHTLFQKRTSVEVLRDDVPDRFKEGGYRPHMTLGWGVEEVDEGNVSWTDALYPQGTVGGPPGGLIQLSGIIDAVGIASYPLNWPEEGTVDMVELEYLRSTVLGSNGPGSHIVSLW